MQIPKVKAIQNYRIYNLHENAGYKSRVEDLSSLSWPKFLRHGNVFSWDLLFDMFPEFQIVICDTADNLIAAGHCVPLHWNGTVADLPVSIEDILLRAKSIHSSTVVPNTISALAAMVNPNYHGHHLSYVIIQTMKSVAAKYNCSSLIAPVRPTWKSRYPLADMESYVSWRRTDGNLYDPWLRVHMNLGATPLTIATNTLTVKGTIQDWESWTDMIFPDNGIYTIPGGLQPLTIDLDKDLGKYEDPNYWLLHSTL